MSSRLPSSADPLVHPEDDDVLASIRNVRKMVEEEFSQANRRRRRNRKTMIEVNGLQQPSQQIQTKKPRCGKKTCDDDVEDDDADANDNDNDKDECKDDGTEDDVRFGSWKNRCFALKQELFEEKHRAASLARAQKNELTSATSRLEEAMAEAARDRETRVALLETLEAQTLHSEGVMGQLAVARSRGEILQSNWKDLVRTMEEEKESMDREREASGRLLDETHRMLTVSRAEREQEERDSSKINEALARRVEELEAVNRSLTTKQEESSSTPAVAAVVGTTLESSCWNKSITKTILQQKLTELEDSLATDAERILSLEKVIAGAGAADKMLSSPPPPTAETTKPPALKSEQLSAMPVFLAAKKNQLNEKKNRLRTDSLSVLGEVIVLQLQRLMEIHRQTMPTSTKTIVPKSSAASKIDTKVVASNNNSKDNSNSNTNTNNDEEWKSILRKLAQNRAKMFELRKDNLGGNNVNVNVNDIVTIENHDVCEAALAAASEQKKRDGCEKEDNSSPSKRFKT